jgi:hypothetical protein
MTGSYSRRSILRILAGGTATVSAKDAQAQMAKKQWTKGYTQSELDRAQQKFGLVFPADLVELLREKRPFGGHDWNDEVAIRQALDWPFEGILFDVEENQLWWPEWGNRPDTANARKEVLRVVISRAPKLIPLLGHRYLPASPNEVGNPVFSVYQSDIIYYGANLEDYFDREFKGYLISPWPKKIKRIPFWSDFADGTR